jgi:HNH endonuclease
MNKGPRPGFGAAHDPAKFWARVQKSDGCWIWTGAKHPTGYGYMHGENTYDADGRKHVRWIKAHRHSWALAHGRPVPDDLVVCHACDNPPCVRPDHLFIGTKRDNSQDAVQKGRSYDRRGLRNPNVKLSRKDVDRICKMYETGRWTQDQLAAKFGVAQAHISRIYRGFHPR